MSEECAKKYLCDVLMGLEQLHSNYILDNSLDATNILLTADGHVKLNEFDFIKLKNDGNDR